MASDGGETKRTCTSHLKQILFLKLLEDTSFDLDELITQQQGQECVWVRIDGDVESDELIE